MSVVVDGKAPSGQSSAGDLDYVRKKLDDVRKDCQWLVGLGAASVLGVVVKENLGATSPAMRWLTFATIILQLLSSMVGALAWKSEVDSAQVYSVLRSRLNRRLVIRNVSVILLALSFALVLWLAQTSPGS